MTVHLQTAHTADLDAVTLDSARRLLYEVFGDLTEADWEHCLGGVHALAWDGSDLVGHGSVVQRRLLHRGRALRTGYVEGVAVRRDRRGRGLGAALVDRLEAVVRAAYELGALSVTEEALGFYGPRGWVRWRGPSFALTPAGVVRTLDDDGGIYVLPGAVALDPAGELVADWRDGDVW